jgi:hypothetical protein
MTDLRDLLDEAAGARPSGLPMSQIRRRADAQTRRRRALAGAALAVIAGMIALAATTLPPRTTPAPPTNPPPRSVRIATPGPLAPGRYVDPVLNPPISFTLPAGTPWRAALVTASSLILASADSAPTVTISLQHWSNVYQPATQPGKPPATAPRPVALVHWLATHPSLQVAVPTQATHLAGQPAERITFTLAPHRRLPAGPALGCFDPSSCLVLADTPDNPVVVSTTDTTTIIAADHDPAELVLVITAPTSAPAIPADTSALNSLIDSLRFE